MVHDRDANPMCVIDTSSIKTMHEAKEGPPPCEEDRAGDLCQPFVSSGEYTCKGDFCPLCSQAHLCDHTCELPCSSVAPPPPVGPMVACDTDGIGDDSLCAAMIVEGSGYTCEADFCPTCDQAHMCDRTCMYPCADASAGNGHRRLDEGNGVMAILSNAVHMDGCDWNTFDDRFDAVAVQCCPEDGGQCGGGMPESCSYDCGMVYVPFMKDCASVRAAWGG